MEMTNEKNNKKLDGHLIGVWKGELMKGVWYGCVSWSENGIWSGEGKWEQEQLSLSGESLSGTFLSGTWKVEKGGWESSGNDIGKWNGSGNAKVEGNLINFKWPTLIILVAVIALILNIISAALNVIGGLEWSTNIITIVFCLMF